MLNVRTPKATWCHFLHQRKTDTPKRLPEHLGRNGVSLVGRTLNAGVLSLSKLVGLGLSMVDFKDLCEQGNRKKGRERRREEKREKRKEGGGWGKKNRIRSHST